MIPLVSFVSAMLFSLTQHILLMSALNVMKLWEKNSSTREARNRRGGGRVRRFDGEEKTRNL